MLGEEEFEQRDEPMSPWRARWIKFLINPIYIGTLAIINMIFSILLLGSYGEFEHNRNLNEVLKWIILVVNSVYLADCAVNFIVLRPYNVWKNKIFLYLELTF